MFQFQPTLSAQLFTNSHDSFGFTFVITSFQINFKLTTVVVKCISILEMYDVSHAPTILRDMYRRMYDVTNSIMSY